MGLFFARSSGEPAILFQTDDGPLWNDMIRTFAEKLLAASEDESLTPAELRAWLHLAALRLRKAEPATQAQSLDLINEAKADFDADDGPST